MRHSTSARNAGNPLMEVDDEVLAMVVYGCKTIDLYILLRSTTMPMSPVKPPFSTGPQFNLGLERDHVVRTHSTIWQSTTCLPRGCVEYSTAWQSTVCLPPLHSIGCVEFARGFTGGMGATATKVPDIPPRENAYLLTTLILYYYIAEGSVVS